MWLYEYTSTTIQKYGVSNICLHAFIQQSFHKLSKSDQY